MSARRAVLSGVTRGCEARCRAAVTPASRRVCLGLWVLRGPHGDGRQPTVTAPAAHEARTVRR